MRGGRRASQVSSGDSLGWWVRGCRPPLSWYHPAFLSMGLDHTQSPPPGVNGFFYICILLISTWGSMDPNFLIQQTALASSESLRHCLDPWRSQIGHSSDLLYLVQKWDRHSSSFHALIRKWGYQYWDMGN